MKHYVTSFNLISYCNLSIMAEGRRVHLSMFSLSLANFLLVVEQLFT